MNYDEAKSYLSSMPRGVARKVCIEAVLKSCENIQRLLERAEQRLYAMDCHEPPRKTIWFIERRDGTVIFDSPARLLRRAEQSDPIPTVQRARYETIEGVGNSIFIDYFEYILNGKLIFMSVRVK